MTTFLHIPPWNLDLFGRNLADGCYVRREWLSNFWRNHFSGPFFFCHVHRFGHFFFTSLAGTHEVKSARIAAKPMFEFFFSKLQKLWCCEYPPHVQPTYCTGNFWAIGFTLSGREHVKEMPFSASFVWVILFWSYWPLNLTDLHSAVWRAVQRFSPGGNCRLVVGIRLPVQFLVIVLCWLYRTLASASGNES